MSSQEFIKVVLTFCLLFSICVLGMLPGSIKVTELTRAGVEVTFPLYDSNTKSASLNPTKYFSKKLSHWTKDVTHKAIIFLLSFFMIVRPDLKRWNFDLSWIWVFFFLLMGTDYVLSRGRLPWDFFIEVFLMIVQLGYTVYCYYLYYSSKQVES